MPQLDSDLQEQVEEAKEWGDQPIGILLDEGWYLAELLEVQDKGEGRWDWVFQVAEDEQGNTRTGRLWWTTTTSPESIGKLKATFIAFDATFDTETDELIGEKVLVYSVQQTARAGKRKGHTVNSMAAIKAVGTSDAEASTKAM